VTQTVAFDILKETELKQAQRAKVGQMVTVFVCAWVSVSVCVCVCVCA